MARLTPKMLPAYGSASGQPLTVQKAVALAMIPEDPALYCAFSTSSGWLSRGIRWFTRGKVSHAFFLFYSPEWACWLAVGANANGITIETLAQFLKRGNTVVYAFQPLTVNLWDGLRKHVSDLNKSYNYTGLFGMAFVELSQLVLKRSAANRLSNKAELFCSEWMDMVLGDTFPPGNWYSHQNADTVAPEALSKVLLEHFKDFRSYEQPSVIWTGGANAGAATKPLTAQLSAYPTWRRLG